MFQKMIKLVALLGLGTLVGCASIKRNCPEDPFDPNASGLCRLLYTKEDQQNRLDKESQQGDRLQEKGDKLKEQEVISIAEFRKSRAAAAELRAELTAQQGRAAEAEARVEALRASGQRSQQELDDINTRLVKVQELLAEANGTEGSTPDDVGKLQLLKQELEDELNSLLDM